jgi:putative SOS response-associated peptidase YedK
MCGRFAQTTPADDLVRLFKLVLGLNIAPRFNIAPTQEALVIRPHSDGRRAHLHRWGLTPPWAPDLKQGARMINARAETLFDKPSFKQPARTQRCIFPVSAFYEWRRTATGKDPMLFTAPSSRPLALAGVWSIWTAVDGAQTPTASIVTTTAGPDMVDIHSRMPVLLGGAALTDWLDPKLSDPCALQQLLAPAPRGSLVRRSVSRHVNSVRNEGPECWKATQ